MPPKRTEPTVQVDPLDLEAKSAEERLQLAIQAINRNGFKSDGNPVLSFHEAAQIFQVPNSTLTARFHGRQTRTEAHEKERKLSAACEDALVEWVKQQGRRNVPLHPSAVAAHAKVISGVEVRENWVKRFQDRHRDLKSKWTTGQEKCRAGALNKTAVEQFQDELEAIKKEYKIKDENTYNMDEKGCQLGIGTKIKALIDRDQKNAQLLEDGNRELVTVIECVCADGTAIRPNVVFQGKRHNLEWGRKNPCDASISHSPKGWTDQDLGSKWLERDFEPQTREKAGPDEYRLLILDGHNSHTTYRFCSFAEKHKIIVLCLPPHTTHCLQPCDVGVFGPLSSTWKSVVTELSIELIPIRKNNFLEHYGRARQKAFKKETIISAWRKTGIVPFDRAAIPEEAYAPALNTTTKAAQPVAAFLPSFLIPTAQAKEELGTAEVEDVLDPNAKESSDLSLDSESPSATSTKSTVTAKSIEDLPDEEYFARMTTYQMYEFVNMPPQSSWRASKEELRDENVRLRDLLDKACFQMQRDYALKKLMDRENGRLHRQLFEKQSQPGKKYATDSDRHLTSQENLERLAMFEWKAAMKDLFASDAFKALKKGLDAEEKRLALEEKEHQKEQKRVEQEEKQRQKEQEQEEKRQEKERQRMIKEAEKAVKDRLAAEKKKAVEEKKRVAAEKKAIAAEKKAVAAAKKQQQAAAKPMKGKGKAQGKGTCGKGKKAAQETDSDEELTDKEDFGHQGPLSSMLNTSRDSSGPSRPIPEPQSHPKPRPIPRCIVTVEELEEGLGTRRPTRRNRGLGTA